MTSIEQDVQCEAGGWFGVLEAILGARTAGDLLYATTTAMVRDLDAVDAQIFVVDDGKRELRLAAHAPSEDAPPLASRLSLDGPHALARVTRGEPEVIMKPCGSGMRCVRTG